MKLLRELEDRRVEEMFNGERCKQCSGPLGDGPRQMPRHPELPDYCQHCGDDVLAPSNYTESYAERSQHNLVDEFVREARRGGSHPGSNFDARALQAAINDEYETGFKGDIGELVIDFAQTVGLEEFGFEYKEGTEVW